ncbi:hypothetical protein G3O06_17460 [Burkholderia sp. Ac-20345]|uniref:hypothetical protein n=1 Tax=Burkholderia sp. Ac-20345 TaxID=2703891 RepID=UPI00197BB9FC|nr:hypothetical protein [Burkholderia sp. Ac-20345]MBN3779325.1 hypothetical protein [Burkholderia sp. Ac-20345]
MAVHSKCNAVKRACNGGAQHVQNSEMRMQRDCAWLINPGVQGVAARNYPIKWMFGRRKKRQLTAQKDELLQRKR